MAKLIEAVTGADELPGEAEGAETDALIESGAEDAEEEGGGDEGPEEEGEKPEQDKAQAKKGPWTPEMQKAFEKRIGKFTAERKSLEERAAEAEEELKALRERTDAEDAEAVLPAAREAGVMPEMLGTAEAKGLADLSHARRNARALSEALEDQDGDEVTVQGETYARREVKQSLRVWKEKQEALERRFGRVEERAREKCLEVWKLGLAAKKAGWKPGAGEKDEGAGEKAEGGRLKDEGGRLKDEGGRARPKADFPDGGGGGGAKPRGAALIEVKSTNDLAAWIQQDGARKVKK